MTFPFYNLVGVYIFSFHFIPICKIIEDISITSKVNVEKKPDLILYIEYHHRPW